MSSPFRFLLAASALTTASVASAEVHYTEHFDYPTGTPTSMNTAGWLGYAENGTGTVTAYTSSGVSNQGNPFIASSQGDDPAFNGGLLGPNGQAAKATTGGAGAGFVHTNFTGEFTALSLAALQIDTITFSTRNAFEAATDYVRFALRVDSQWYVTNATFGNAAGQATFSEHSITFSSDGSQWRTLAFSPATGENPTGTLSVGSTVVGSLPTGTVDSVGFFLMNTANGTLRYDNLVVNVTTIPEPSTAAALIGAVALGVIAVRRRRV